ncbi:MAG: hypothetical protein V2B18_10145 [Pseudomonadota bacterium]
MKAAIIVNTGDRVEPIAEGLSRKGFRWTVEHDPQAVLGSSRTDPLDLVIVFDRLDSMTGRRFLSQLVGISWTTAAVLIMDEDEEKVHEMTEGLGILGSIRNVDDTDGLLKLLDKFLSMKQPV